MTISAANADGDRQVNTHRNRSEGRDQHWSNACRSPSASVKAAVMGPALVRRAIVMEIMVMETVKSARQKNRTADKEQRPIEPGVPPVVWLGVGIQIDRLWRQRVDLLRQSRRIQRDLPAAIGLLARLPDGLSRLPFNRDLRGELAAILKGPLCWDECCVWRARGNLPGTARQYQRYCDTQKGMRTSISRDRATDR